MPWSMVNMIGVLFYTTMRYLLLAFICLITSCTTERSATSWMNNHEYVLAYLCASNYPSKETYITGKIDTLIKRDTITGDSIVIPCPEQKEKGQVVYAKCPPNKTITNTIETIRIDTIVQVDSALSVVLRYENRNIKQDYDKVRNIMFWSLALAVVLLLVIVFRK